MEAFLYGGVKNNIFRKRKCIKVSVISLSTRDIGIILRRFARTIGKENNIRERKETAFSIL